MMAAWGDISEEDEPSEEEEVIVALMDKTESESNVEPVESPTQGKGTWSLQG